MALSSKNKQYVITGLFLSGMVLILFYFGEIVLPFLFAIFISYLINPTILKFQKILKNRNVAITIFLTLFSTVLLGSVYLFGSHVVTDSKRFVGAVKVFADKNQSAISEMKTDVFDLVDETYSSETVQNLILQTDSISDEEKKEGVLSAISSVYSLFDSNTDEETEEVTTSWSVIYMIGYTMVYVVLILYSFDYFESNMRRYFGKSDAISSKLALVWSDYKIVFVNYLKQRSKVVVLNLLVFVLAFSILDLPGAIIIGVLAGVLSYASHFHYFSLPLAGISCWVLSIENGHSFFLYFGIVFFVFVLISVLDETIYFDRIMKSVNGMNPAVILLSFTLWISIFGSFTGTIIALPLSQLILVYIKRFTADSLELEE